MVHPRCILNILAITTMFPMVHGAKILFIIHIPSLSHLNVFEPIVEELFGRNHSITVLSYNHLKKLDLNVTQMPLQPLKQEKSARMKSILENTAKSSMARLQGGVVQLAKAICKNLLTDGSTKTLLSKRQSFDLVVVDALIVECAVALASMLGKNVIIFYTSRLMAWRPTSAPEPSCFVPNDLEFLPSKMTFWQRFHNAFSHLGIRYVQEFHLIPAQQEIISKFLPKAPKIEEVMKQVSFHITNADPVLSSVRPSMPNIAHCGTLHCRRSKPLPKDLNEFVESSGEDGFIVFGLGSNIEAEYLPSDITQAILSSFGRLKQKVVWKFESQLPNLPPNVRIVRWMPQQDLLGHPKARLFITHGGLLSLQEAVFHGVPVIAIPIFSEQPGNAARVVEIGVGEHISLLNITSDGLHQIITKVLTNRSYLENVKKYSSILKDQPQRPVDKAVFWIEYVLRHDGALHFRSAGDDLNFFQYFVLDVIAVLGSMAIVSLVLVICSVRLCLRKLLPLNQITDNTLGKKRQ